MYGSGDTGMDEVIPGLFIGPKESAEPASIRGAGISAIVSIGCEEPPIESRGDVHYLGFSHILDTPESVILHIFARTTEFITSHLQQGRSVLVHCIYGQSRSATVIAAYLLSIGHSLDAALTLLKTKHDNICINPGFLTQVNYRNIVQIFQTMSDSDC